MRVLLVDQDGVARMLTRRLLADAGHEAVEVRTATEALKVLSNTRIDAMLMDPVLSDLDGLELIGVLREDPYTARLPVVVYSTAAERARVLQAAGLGIRHFLVKPVDGPSLMEDLQEALDTAPPLVSKQIEAQMGKMGLEPAFRVETVEQFARDARQVLRELYPAVCAGDAQAWAALSGRLQSAAQSVGATCMAKAVSAVVRAAHQRRLAEAIKHFNYLESLVMELERHARELAGGGCATAAPSPSSDDEEDEAPFSFFGDDDEEDDEGPLAF